MNDTKKRNYIYRKSRLKGRVGKKDAHTKFLKNQGKILKKVAPGDRTRNIRSKSRMYDRRGTLLQAKHISERIDRLMPKYCMKTYLHDGKSSRNSFTSKLSDLFVGKCHNNHEIEPTFVSKATGNRQKLPEVDKDGPTSGAIYRTSTLRITKIGKSRKRTHPF